ncbi:hypothetical protein PENSUB_8945 [Penicillium subrubescens]|uniref:Uncharacterized protein n=1 Tax=Penicillium subrubescens TaxID=1316194 RepID=A0A1Q5TEN8_9EURO|nr:hypothetical protein PENSUB_8945 [Penicillium subrubescens]
MDTQAQFHQSVPGNPDHRPVYADQGQYPVQNHQQPTWGSHAQMTQMLPGGPTANSTTEQYHNFPMDAQQPSQMSAYTTSIAYPGSQRSGLVQPVFSSSQPAWQLGGHHTKSSHPPQPSSDHYSLTNLSQPFYGSQPIPQTSGQHPGEPASRSSQPSIPYHTGSAHSGNQVEMHQPRGSLSAQSHGNSNQGNNIASHPLSRSQSHQSAGFQHDQQDGLGAGSHTQPSVHDYGPQLSNGQSSYQSTDMSRTQRGPGFNSMVFPTAPGAHGGPQHYQNPVVQAGVHHYLSQQPQNSTHSDVTNQHRANYHPHSSQSTVPQGQWTTSASASRIAASDPQFVSGPWASSTPPTSGPSQQLHYG